MMDSFFLTITWFGSLYLLLPISVIVSGLLLASRRPLEAVLVFGGLLGSSLITHILKLLFARPRPQVEELLVTMPADFSFPSAHTSQITALACALALVFSRHLPGKGGVMLWLSLAILVALVGISRNYLKVHYISDVIAGAALGAVWVVLLHWLLYHLGNRGL